MTDDPQARLPQAPWRSPRGGVFAEILATLEAHAAGALPEGKR